MTKDDFKWWRDAMGFVSQQMAGDALGLSRDTIKNYETGSPIPKPVALACAALWHRQKPWPECR